MDITWPKADDRGWLKVTGGKISYRLYGKNKSKTPIIFIHGGPGGNYGAFYRLLPLAQERPVVFYQQIGSKETQIDSQYQDSDNLKKLFCIENYIKELNTVIKFFNFKEYILYGSSWGSMLGVEYINKYKPNNLKAYIMAGACLNSDIWVKDQHTLIKSLRGGNEMLNEILKCEESGVYTKKYNEIKEKYMKNFNKRKNVKRPEMNELQELKITPYNHMWGQSEFTCNGTLKHHDCLPYLKNIRIPILYIVGEYDEARPDTVRYFSSLSKNAKVAIISDAGHSSANENPQEVLAVLEQFFGSNDKNLCF